jgi:hypothetical protein
MFIYIYTLIIIIIIFNFKCTLNCNNKTEFLYKIHVFTTNAARKIKKKIICGPLHKKVEDCYKYILIFRFRLINGIIEYDQKVEFFFKSTSTHHRSQSQTYWNTVFIVLITYYVITTVIIWIFHPPQSMNVLVFFTYIFQLQYFIDFTIVTSTYFFLTNLEFRFQMLNNLWKLYPIEIFTIPGGWTCSKITMFLEDIRLLHAELSELLKIFSVGYGKMLLGFFVFSYIDILFLYFLLIHLSLDEQGSISVTVTVLITSGLGKTIAFIMSIILATSRVNKEVNICYVNIIKSSNII